MVRFQDISTSNNILNWTPETEKTKEKFGK